MRVGLSFLQSKITRRFFVLFIVSAFLPTVLLVVFSYNRVVSQIEEQSFTRLKNDANAYAMGLFDRMIRVDNELENIAKAISMKPAQAQEVIENYQNFEEKLFYGIVEYDKAGRIANVYNTIKAETLQQVIPAEKLHLPKPFIVSLITPDGPARLFFSVNKTRPDGSPFSVIGEVNPSYLWGVGANPLLPPMTDLTVFNSLGEPLIASINSPPGNYQEMPKASISDDLRLFKYEHEGNTFFASYTNLFIESRFQRTGWVIIISQARDDIMSALSGFKTTFPLFILLFLLIILYTSLSFIRKGLEPLAILKTGTQRVAQKDFATKVNIDSDDEFEELGNAFNYMTARIEQQFRTLSVLSDIDRAILSSVNRTSIIATTLQRIKEFFHCEIALYIKCSSSSDRYGKMYIMRGRRKSDPLIDFLELTDDDRSLIFSRHDYLQFDENSIMPSFLKDFQGEVYTKFWCLPITIDDTTERALLLGWKETHPGHEDNLGQARQIANQLSVALTNARLLENLEKLAKGTIEALARTVDAKSKWTAGHSERVAAMSARIAKTMGLTDSARETLTRGALLHDIGKIGISQTILDKPARLNEEEYAEVKNHPQIGAKILEPIAAYQDILPVVAQHHEKFDGSGYPYGLKRDEIDIRARIIAVADVWDALVSDRPYREGWIQDRAKKLIVNKAGEDFDPVVVKAFLVVIADDFQI